LDPFWLWCYGLSMRLGCLGCFVLILVVLTALVVVGGALFLSGNIFAIPDVKPSSYSRSDGYSAQQKLFEIAQRQSGRSTRKDPIVLNEREANAFIANHLSEAAGVSLSPLTIKFSRGQFWAQGQTALRNLFLGPPLSYVLKYIPDNRLNLPVWVTVRGHVSIEDGVGANSRHGVISVTELTLGRQSLHSFVLYLLLGPSGSGLLRWPVPRVVESIQIEDGQAILHTR
jgi:hypothetical protein